MCLHGRPAGIWSCEHMQNITKPDVSASISNLVCVTLHSGCTLCQGLCYVLTVQAVRDSELCAHAQFHQAGVLGSISSLGNTTLCEAHAQCTLMLCDGPSGSQGLRTLSTGIASPSWCVGKPLKPGVHHSFLGVHTHAMVLSCTLTLCDGTSGSQELGTLSACTTSLSWCEGKHLRPCGRHECQRCTAFAMALSCTLMLCMILQTVRPREAWAQYGIISSFSILNA